MKAIWKGFIIGIVLIVIGAGIIIATIVINGKSVKEENYTMETFTAENDNTAVEIDLGANALKTEFYDGDKIEISYPVSKAFKTSVTERDGKLKFETKTKWYLSFFNINNPPETIIKLPKDKIFDLKIDLGAGTINLDGGVYGDLDIDVSTGTLKGSDIICNQINCDVSTGKLNFSALTCDKIVCAVSTGRLNFTSLTCPDIKADVSTGKLILGIVGEKSEYTINSHVSTGSCNVSNQTGTTDKKLTVDVSTGTISVDFNG